MVAAMGCQVCGAALEVGALCRAHAHEAAPPDGMIQDHLRSRVPPGEEVACVIDGFGTIHLLAEKTTVGRSPEGQLVVLAASVSREHAELVRKHDGWYIRDLGSRNGTFVFNERCQGRVPLRQRALLRIGDVPLWFLPEVVDIDAPPPSQATVSVDSGFVSFRFQTDAHEFCVLGESGKANGGMLMSRPAGTQKWAEVKLAPLEFQLMRTLCARAIEDADSPSSVRGCVATSQLATDLPFKTRYANDENVRQVVRRLRGALAEAGGEGLLAVDPGRGYYISSVVRAGTQ